MLTDEAEFTQLNTVQGQMSRTGGWKIILRQSSKWEEAFACVEDKHPIS